MKVGATATPRSAATSDTTVGQMRGSMPARARNAFISHAAAGARTTAIGIYLSCYYFDGSLGSVLPIPAWHHWSWAGCAAFVAAAQAPVGLLVFAFWRPERAATRSDARGAPGQSPG
ncbi:hypothetical protein [Paraburkholderia guartelaensis]|uniref:hypothetical protein n=1 Tax=Paraburkholderia guartelaensis TaxID=2546446 RepID=UPI001FE9E25A|nr:hypothetical protein [Paraburkholderia guartelaensis]